MKKEIRSRVIKMLLIASVLLLMLTLCGCRTRITNNDEVSNVMYDEEGWMQDDYDMRRDDLGLSKAQKPLFTGFGSPEEEEYEDEYYSDDEQMLDDYEPEEDIEDDTEEPETKPKSTSTNSGTTRPGTTTRPVQRRTTPTQTTTTSIQVVLDAGTNGGTISGKDTFTVNVKKGDTYSVLFDPDDRDGYTFKGWYTKKSGGTKVTTETKVSVDKKHKLYAQWKKSKKKKTEPEKEEPKEEEPKKEEPEKEEPVETLYTVVYTDGVEGEAFSNKSFSDLKEGSSTPGYGKDPVRDGYSFLGWDPEPTDTLDVGRADSSHTITYVAIWEEDKFDHWKSIFTTESKTKSECIVVGADDDCESMAQECGVKKKDEADIVIVFTDNMDDTGDLEGEYPEAKRIIAVSKKAAKDAARDKDKQKSLYTKLLLMNKMRDLDIDGASDDLEISDSDDDIVSLVKYEE